MTPISGVDSVWFGLPNVRHLEAILEVITSEWPHGLLNTGDDSLSCTLPVALQILRKDTRELFQEVHIYRTSTDKAEWKREGRTTLNASGLITLLMSDQGFTFVSEGRGTDLVKLCLERLPLV